MPPARIENEDNGFSTSVKEAKITQSRPVAVDIDADIDLPSVPRANLAVSRDSPNGTPTYQEKYKEYTTLQQHILFWDRDSDGQITPWDTYVGFRELGFNIAFCLLAVVIINLNFSYPSRLAYSWLPDPFFRVYVGSIHKAKHGSDSGVIDGEGRFVPQAFENLFSKYDKKGDGTLTLSEVFGLMHGQRVAADPFGWGAAFFEWGTTWLLLQRNGRIYKEDLRKIFDGSIFWDIREKRRTTGKWDQGFGLGGDGMIGSVQLK